MNKVESSCRRGLYRLLKQQFFERFNALFIGKYKDIINGFSVQDAFKLRVYGFVEKGEYIYEKRVFRGIDKAIGKSASRKAVNKDYMLLLRYILGNWFEFELDKAWLLLGIKSGCKLA